MVSSSEMPPTSKKHVRQNAKTGASSNINTSLQMNQIGSGVSKQMSSNSNRLKKSSHADRANSHTIGGSMGLNKHHHSSVSAGLN